MGVVRVRPAERGPSASNRDGTGSSAEAPLTPAPPPQCPRLTCMERPPSAPRRALPRLSASGRAPAGPPRAPARAPASRAGTRRTRPRRGGRRARRSARAGSRRARPEVLQHRAHPSRDLDRRRAVHPDLVEGQVERVGPARRAPRQPDRPVRAARDRRLQVARGELRAITSSASSACTAVVGSFTAGDRARIAVSTMIRMAKAGSCWIVRSSAMSTAPRSVSSSSGTSPCTRSSVWPGTMNSPGPGRARSSAPAAIAAASSASRSNEQTTPG